MKRWLVGEHDGDTVGGIVVRMGEELRAIAEGRVFVGRVRASLPSHPVSVGDEITVAAEIAQVGDVELLSVTDELAVANKPAGIPTIPDLRGGAHSLMDRVAKLLGVGRDQLHATSRLDNDVSGVVVFARTKTAIERLRVARERGEYERRYIAIAKGLPEPSAGEWNAAIGRARDPKLRAVDGRDATNATSRYRVVAESAGYSVLSLTPITGRTHQLRIHASDAKAPLIGDGAYGGPKKITLPSGKIIEPRRILLHAARVTLSDRETPQVFEAPIPQAFAEMWSALAGAATAFVDAVHGAS